MPQGEAVFVDSGAWIASRCHEIRCMRKRESNGTYCTGQVRSHTHLRSYCY
jgi:hypothetical protein